MKLNWIAAKIALIHSEVSEMEEAETDENFAEELADICIRTFDLIGGLEVNLYELVFDIYINPDRSIHWYISQALEYLRKADCFNTTFEQTLINIYLRCEIKATDYGVNLKQAIKKKMEYNRTRPYKHGKKL